jgi:hypothetical protein
VVVLQNCVNLLEAVPGSYNEPCREGNQLMHIEVEEVADVIEEGEEDPLAVIKSENGVSFMSMCTCCLAIIFPDFPLLLYSNPVTCYSLGPELCILFILYMVVFLSVPPHFPLSFQHFFLLSVMICLLPYSAFP